MKFDKNNLFRLPILMFSLLLVIMGAFICSNTLSDELHADAVTTDIKIKDIYPINPAYAHNYYVVSEEGKLYYSSNSYMGASPFQPVKDEDGNIVINVEKVATYSQHAGVGSSAAVTIVLTEDNHLYVSGVNTYGQLGTGNNNDLSSLKKIDTGVNGIIKSVAVDYNNSYLLMENGDVYAAGYGVNGSLGNGSADNKNLYTKVTISNIKQMIVNNGTCFAIDNDGYLWKWGYLNLGTGNSELIPTRVKNSDGSLFDKTVKLLANPVASSNSGEIGGLVFLGTDNKIYYMKYGYADYLGVNSIYPTEVTFDYGDMSNTTYMVWTLQNFSAIINGTLYTIDDPSLCNVGSDNECDQSSNQKLLGFVPYEKGEITKTTRVVQGGQSYGETWLIREDGKSFFRANPGSFRTEIGIDAKKTDASTYNTSEKYKNDIDLYFNRGDGHPSDTMYYKVRELPNGTFGAEMIVPDSETIRISANADEHVYREYKTYYGGQENGEVATFIVDLYKHNFDEGVPVSDNGSLAIGEDLEWNVNNGLEGNVVKARLLKPGAPVAETISCGYVLETTGAYTLDLIDDYGNTAAINFTALDVPRPKSMLFTKNGNLQYKSDSVILGGTIGNINLQYEENAVPSKIASARIVGGNEDNYFSIKQDYVTNEYVIMAETDVPVGDYQLKLSGTNANNINYRNFVINFSVIKADNPMNWDENTTAAITNGMFINDSLTVGITNRPAEIGAVTYSIEPAVTGVSINSSTGVVTIGAISGDQVVIPIKATTVASTNYNEQSLTGSITAQKQTLKLKTVSVDNGNNKDTIQYELGATLPTFKVVPSSTLPSGFTLVQPTSYKIVKQGDATESAVTTITTTGTYLIKPVYAANTFNQYKMDWTYGTIVASAVTIDEDNASSYYTLTLDDGMNTSYVPGTWTNKNVIITPIHLTYTKMKVDTGSYDTNAQTYRVEGTNAITLTFQTESGITTSTTINNVKIDKTKPTVDNIYYNDSNTSILASILRAFTFDKFFSSEQIATFAGSDGSGSGVNTYHYTLTEIDENGNAIAGEAPLEADGTSVTLPKNKNYKIEVKAIDNAKNESNSLTHYIQINDVAPNITITANLSGTSTTYVGSEWTSKAIDVVLTSGQNITDYVYSTDGTTYTPMTNGRLTIPNTTNIDDKTYTFKGTSSTNVDGFNTMQVKIDKDVPTFDMSVKLDDASDYDGTKTENNVIVTLSQTTPNISGVDYYYCDDASLSAGNPIDYLSRWTKVTDASGTRVTFDDALVNTTYYFKAVSRAGLASADAKAQVVNIEKKIDNPEGLVWETPEDQEVTYGGSIPLTILLDGVEVAADEITITANGGTNCLSYSDTTREVTATSGTCPTGGEMKISAQVGRYRDPLRKTINAKKADLQLQTEFEVSGASSKTANILKGGTIPPLTVDFVSGKELIASDASKVSNAGALGTYTTKYTKADDTILSTIDTTILGDYKIRQNLSLSSVTTISNFSSKYNVTSLDATLSVNDNSFSDSELYEIEETPNENDWFNDRITITPVHVDFPNMSIEGNMKSTGSQVYPSGDIIDVNKAVELKFYDASLNSVTKKPTIKIDSQVPQVQIEAKSNGTTYNGTQTEHDVTIKLSQPATNISGVTYYYCTNLSTSQSSPTGSGWTKIEGTSLTLDTTQNKTYYFKAISGAGLASESAVSQTVNILKKESNPVDMVWGSGIKEDLAYGETTTLSIDNTQGNSITYTSEGGEGCLSIDDTTGLITALSGTCATNMVVTAQVGNYATPLTKTIQAHKANLDFQTVFVDGVTTKKTATILKNEEVPNTKVQLINSTSLKGDEASLDITTIGTYRNYYTFEETTTTGIDTGVLGEYKVSKKLDSSTVTIDNFASKYKINLQEVATLQIVDNDLPAEQLYTITGDHVNDDWFTDAVKISPIHEIFTKMGINGGTTSAQVQTYPKDGPVDMDTTISLTFENNGGSNITKPSVPIKIDSMIPDFRVSAKSNRTDYTSGTSTLYDIDISFVSLNTNISGVKFYYTTDVASNGNVKPNANWIESEDFQIVKNATYYMKVVSGAGLESTPKKFIANINKPDTTKTPTITTTSNNKSFVADGSIWARNDVTFKLAGNATGYEVCVSTDKDRSVDCDDQSYNWTTIDDESNSIHSITQDQDATYYWFRNKLPGFQTTASEAYIVTIDNVVPDTPQITVTEKQNALMALFARSSGAYHNKAVDVAIDAQDDRSGLASITYDIYDADGVLLKENQSYTEVLTYEDINIQISAKATDKAGNISETSGLASVCVDTIAPQISGVKDEGNYYVPYLFISYQDSGSGIDSTSTTYTNNDKTEELGNNTLFNGKGNVSVNVQDLAGNASSISFEMLGLPERTDCSTQSMALIDTVKAQYDDVKGHLNDTQKKEITDWMAKASSSCSVTDPDHNVTVENPEAKIPENTVLVVDVITTTIDDVELSLEKDEEVKVAYDVYFKKGETVFKDLEGSEMKVKLPLGAFKGAKGLRLVSVEEDGKAKDIVYVTEGDYAVFTTSELKRYAFIAEKSADPNVNVDTDCDGTPDINIDTGNDGIPDINIDTTGDGKANYNVDIDDDQIPDVNIGPIDWNPDKCVTTPCGKAYCTSTYYKPYLNIDTDGDMRPDINIDLDKDMEADINIDTDFDDIPNIDIDSDGDGKADINIDKEGDGKADQNLLDLKHWKPEFNVDTPFKYDTMAGLKADTGLSDDDDSSDDANTSNKDQDDKNHIKQVDITPTVKGNYTGGIGGAMTGQTNQLPVLIVMLLSSTCVLLKMKKKKT